MSKVIKFKKAELQTVNVTAKATITFQFEGVRTNEQIESEFKYISEIMDDNLSGWKFSINLDSYLP
jgi:hypothetical protein|tara:strand:- start:847 stop:1044 length:198 start_codon:yes stop_codon:yes gene_type:complete